MLRIEVDPPAKTRNSYEFRCHLTDTNPFGRFRLNKQFRYFIRKYPVSRRGISYRFGFRAQNFEIAHHELWDSIYPLAYMVHIHGPLIESPYRRARVVIRYPVLRLARDFFIRRAGCFGIRLEVEAPVYDADFEIPTKGRVMPYGDGKESRLIYGMLKELGYETDFFMTWKPRRMNEVTDVRTKVSLQIGRSMVDRWMPALMAAGEICYVGSDLNACHHVPLWHRYSDTSPFAWKEFSRFLQAAGVRTKIVAPTVLVPTVWVQGILAKRYPALLKGQQSVFRNKREEKNLKVSLCKLHHGLFFEDHCSPELFRSMLGEFVASHRKRKASLGYHDSGYLIHKELKALIYRNRTHPLVRDIAGDAPPAWDAPHLDYVHAYVDPDVDPAFRAIYADYLPQLDRFNPEDSRCLPGFVPNGHV